MTSVDSRVDKTKRGIGGLSYPVSRISGGRHPWVWQVHEDASCQVPRISGGCRAPFNKARDPYEDIYCAKRKTCPWYQILGNRRDVSVPFLPVSDWPFFTLTFLFSNRSLAGMLGSCESFQHLRMVVMAVRQTAHVYYHRNMG